MSAITKKIKAPLPSSIWGWVGTAAVFTVISFALHRNVGTRKAISGVVPSLDDIKTMG